MGRLPTSLGRSGLISKLRVRSARSPWRQLVRSFATLAAGETAARLIGFIAVALMARRLGPGGFGIAVVGVTLVHSFRSVMDSGTEIMGVRDTSRTSHRFRELTEPVLGLRLALSLAASMLFALIALVIPGTADDRQALLMFALVLPMMGLNIRFMVLGVDAPKAVASGHVASQILLAVGVLIFVHDRKDLLLVPLLYAAAELLYASVVLASVARRSGVLRPRVEIDTWRRAVRSGLPLAITGLAGAVKYPLGLLLIAALLGAKDVGLFGAAYKPVMFFSTLLALLSISFLSYYSRSVGGEEHRELTRKTVTTAALVSIPLAMVISAGSATAMSLAFGPDYAGSATPFAILAWTLPLLAMSLPYANILIAGDKQGVFMRHNIAGAIVNVAATAGAVPLFGLAGAAGATVASSALVMVLNYRSAARFGLTEPLWPVTSRRNTGHAATVPVPSQGKDPGMSAPASPKGAG